MMQPIRQGQPKIKRRNTHKTNKSPKCSLSTLIVYSMVGVMFLYVTAMVALTRYATTTTAASNTVDGNNSSNNNHLRNPQQQPAKKQYSRDEWGDRNHPYDAKRGWGHGVEPEQVIKHGSTSSDEEQRNPYKVNKKRNAQEKSTPSRILTAYIEPIDQSSWEIKPLPTRQWTSEDLKKVEYPQVNSCPNLPSQWPVDDPPTNQDPFLPWIHDVFPTHDGKFVQFIAQNKQRCRTGTTQNEKDIMRMMKPQVALFQHVAVKRVDHQNQGETRYQLTSHDDADSDGMSTRFICKFQPSGEETLSQYNFLYEYASYRKRNKVMFHEDTGDNKLIHTSQLTFLCPVPASLQDQIRTGESVVDDQATIYVDLIPIRTPPRYGAPNEFLPPYYKDFRDSNKAFNVTTEWGNSHILPQIQDSGRWANIPICKPTLQTYGKPSKEVNADNNYSITPRDDDKGHNNDDDPNDANKMYDLSKDTFGFTKFPTNKDDNSVDRAVKTHRLVSCIWASTGYATRGNRFAINDGQRRLLEWIEYNRLIGVEHFYLYDNSAAFGSDNVNLQSIADMFPDDVTRIEWPSKVCNNNPNNVDSVGERSSQYAAEASCRLRFGPHVDWIAQFDIDEYLVPMGNLTSIHPLLDRLEEEGNKIVSFGSWRAWPRRRFIEYVFYFQFLLIETMMMFLLVVVYSPCCLLSAIFSSVSSFREPNDSRLHGAKHCGRNTDCFQLKVPMNYTMLQSYNCDRQKPGLKKERMPAEKQLYRPDYVKHHFIHYSTVTTNSILNKGDTQKVTNGKYNQHPFPDPLSRFGNEVNEGK